MSSRKSSVGKSESELADPDRYVEDVLNDWDGESTILVGESHVNPAHKAVEERLVGEVQPDYLFHEGLESSEPREFNLIDLPLTLKELEEDYSAQFPEDPEFMEEEYSEILEDIISDSFKRDNISDIEIPETVGDLRNTPFYRMDNTAIGKLTQSITSKIYQEGNEFQKMSKFERSEIDKEYIQRDQKISKLQETLEQLRSFTSEEFDRRAPWIDYMSKNSPETELVGPDLDSDVASALYNPVRNSEVHRSEYENMVREVEMAQRIESYSSENDVSIVVLGENHIENVSELMDSQTYNLPLESEFAETDDHSRKIKYNESFE